VASARETPPGAPEPEVDRARAAYDRGVCAHALHDHAGAARAFAEADALAPAPASLEAALEAAMRADDALLGAELVDRAEGRATDPGVARSLLAARRRFAGRTGKVRIECRSESRCLASVDGVAADARRPIYVAAGPHAVVVQRGDERFERLVEVRGDAVVVVAAPEDARSRAGGANGVGVAGGSGASGGGVTGADDERAREGLAPTWFFVGVGVTALASGLTLASGLDAVAKHDQFAANGCGSGATGPRASDCDARGRAGESAQLRTNLLLGASSVLAVATVAVGVFAVRWKDGTRARVALSTTRASVLAGFELVTP
jgi:hypothetical protein